jgi:hypothetical protein
VYAAEIADYGTVLKRLVSGHDINRSALLEKPLAEPLPRESAWPGTAAVMRRFERNSLLVEVEAKTNALLVLAEAWYPGWRADIDGRAGTCVPANLWMRAVPVPAGRHLVRVYFRQNYLLPGFIISLVSVGLLVVAVTKPGRWRPLSPHERDALDMPAAPLAAGSSSLEQPLELLTTHPSAFLACRPLLRVLAAGMVLALAWLVARTEVQRVRLFQTMGSEVQALLHCRTAAALALQHQTVQASEQYAEAVRLAERACKLTQYRKPTLLGTLAFTYAKAGRLDEAVATAGKGRDLALANGQNELAERLLKLMEGCRARKATRRRGA